MRNNKENGRNLCVCGKIQAKTGTWRVDIPWHDQEEGKI